MRNNRTVLAGRSFPHFNIRTDANSRVAGLKLVVAPAFSGSFVMLLVAKPCS